MQHPLLGRLTNPAPLRKGDTIGVISPSAGLAGLFPHRTERGIRTLEDMGFKVLLAPHARKCEGWASSTPERRAEDIHLMFSNPEIKTVLCAIGGNHANQLMPHLDFNLIKKNPKIFIGYSDITVLHHMLATQAGLRTFYGPCLVSEFGEYPKVMEYTAAWFERVLMSPKPPGEVEAPAEWTDEFLDWFTRKDLVRARTMRKHEGYEWWRAGRASGPLWGGAVPSINHLAGTACWVEPTGCVYFIDIPEGAPGERMPLSELDSFLSDLVNLGVFKNIAGLIIGRPYCYTEEDVAALKVLIDYYTRGTGYPILFNASIGHTAPIMTVPLGVRASLDSANNSFVIEEAGVA